MNIQSIIDRIAEAFSLFDFSYFISGVASLSVILTFMWYNGILPEISLPNWMKIAVLLVSIYVSGIVSMACGKWIRMKILSWNWYQKQFDVMTFEEYFDWAIKGVKKEECGENKKGEESKGEEYNVLMADKNIAYTMMWTALRTDEKHVRSVNFINKYWVTQALCEGLMTTCILAIIGVWGTWWLDTKISLQTALVVTFLVLPSFIVLVRYARQNAETQIKEVITAYFLMKRDEKINQKPIK